MFFILSKLFYFLLQPYIWLIIIGVFWLRTNKTIRKKRLGISFVFVFLFFSNSAILKTFLYAWEIHATKAEDLKKNYDVGIVLGGMFEWDNDAGRISARRGSDRIWQALNLYKSKKIKKILISGDSGYVIDRGLDEASQIKEELIGWGIPENDILIEKDSRNTYENAKFTKELLEKEYPKFNSFLLITSARHMRRANACFEKQDLICDVYATDQYTGSKSPSYNWDEFIIPEADALDGWTNLLKEWVGYLVYDVVGYI